MVTSRKRKLKQSDRRYAGEREGLKIVEWLNTRGEDEGKRRFAALLAQLNQLDLLMNEYRRDPDSGASPLLLAAKVNGTLMQHAPYHIQLITDDVEILRVGLVPVYPNASVPIGISPQPDKDGITSYQMPWESVMKAALMFSLWPLGRVDRIRQCKQCARWLFARTALQEFCKATDCRRKFRESRDTFKAKRRRYMRQYYKDYLSTTPRNRKSTKGGTRGKR